MKLENKKIYIHIGLQKAASTFLQLYIFPSLDEKTFYYSPNNSSFLKRFLLGVETQDELTSRIEKINQPKILFSNESYCGSCFKNHASFENNIKKLKELFPEATIIFVLRNQVNWITSLYRQSIRMGGNKSLNKFLNYKDAKFLPRKKEKSYRNVNALDFNWAEKIKIIEDNFGKENTKILFFEDFVKNSDYFFKQLEQIFETKLDKNINFKKVVKKSFSSLGIVLGRILNTTWNPIINLINRVLIKIFGKFDPYGKIIPNPSWEPTHFGERPGKNIKIKSLIKKKNGVLWTLIQYLRMKIHFVLSCLSPRSIIQDFFDKIVYINWPLSKGRKKEVLKEYYSKSNADLKSYFKNSNITNYYL